MEDFGWMLSAARSQDIVALAAMKRDGRIVLLPKGTLIHIAIETDGMAAVQVESRAVIRQESIHGFRASTGLH
jgi:hypothetical protein